MSTNGGAVVLGDEWARGARTAAEAIVGGALLFFGRRRGGVIGFALGSIGGLVLRNALTEGLELLRDVRALKSGSAMPFSGGRDAVDDASWASVAKGARAYGR